MGHVITALWLVPAVVLGTWAALLAVAALYSLVALRLHADRDGGRLAGIETLEDAIARLRASELSGWPLVERAQQLVARHMPEYGYDNSFGTPARAFRRGRGYCWHRTGALYRILRGLGIEARRVYAFCRFDGLIAGHTWLDVTVEGETRPVCPGQPENVPGRLHFTPITKVRPWGPGILLASYLGAPIPNLVAAVLVALRQRRASDGRG
ncbi:MAG TPA: transglutaminase domain-containing protein [Sandaracinaceae bacterium LLY-WYZ-13_1]|nr:transglutaminase domain-containing protein [Sandaracinaceae bacterium LLY-WYZ-13_1]